MFNIFREFAFVVRAAYMVKTIFERNGYKTTSLRRFEEKPVGAEYIQLNVITPSGYQVPFEIKEISLIETHVETCISELEAKGLNFAIGWVVSTTASRYDTHLMTEHLEYRNYMLA